MNKIITIAVIIIIIIFSYGCYYCFITKNVNPYYDPERFAKLKILRDNFEIIQKECLDVYTNCPITDKISRKQDEWINGIDRVLKFVIENENKYWIPAWTEKWSNYGLVINDNIVPGITSSMCPKTTQILKSIGGINIAGFSLVHKDCIIYPHTDSTGPSFGSLTYHLCLTGESKLTVNNIEVLQTPGKVIIFNPEYVHHLKNHSGKDRIILYMDFKI